MGGAGGGEGGGYAPLESAARGNTLLVVNCERFFVALFFFYVKNGKYKSLYQP